MFSQASCFNYRLHMIFEMNMTFIFKNNDLSFLDLKGRIFQLVVKINRNADAQVYLIQLKKSSVA